MKRRDMLTYTGAAIVLTAVSTAAITVAQDKSTADKYTLKVPGGLDFPEFRGYESWEVISVSHNGDHLAVIVGNPAMINAYKTGIPENGQPFPDGARMAKVHWNATKAEAWPGQPMVSGEQHDVDFMVKDTKRFTDGGGWGYAEFEVDPATKALRVGNTTDMPPQANDAKCGVACHTIVKNQDYVFSHYGSR